MSTVRLACLVGGWLLVSLSGCDDIPLKQSIKSLVRDWSNAGALDTSFDPLAATKGPVYALVVQSDGKVLAGGDFSVSGGAGSNRIIRLNADGSLDNTFVPGSGLNGPICDMVLQASGAVLMSGDFTSVDGSTLNRIARLDSGGGIDSSFNTGSGANGVVVCIAPTASSIYIGGGFTVFNGTNGVNALARLSVTGALDAGFATGSGCEYAVICMAIQTDGKLLIGGDFGTYNGISRSGIARVNVSGSLDTSFDSGAGVTNRMQAIVVQPDGKIIIGGWFTAYNGTARNRIARLNTDGSLDASFDPGSGANERIRKVLLQPDGRILICGDFTSYNGIPRGRVARLNQDGSLDTIFHHATGADATVHTLVLQPDDQILIGGEFTAYDGTPRLGVARLQGN